MEVPITIEYNWICSIEKRPNLEAQVKPALPSVIIIKTTMNPIIIMEVELDTYLEIIK